MKLASVVTFVALIGSAVTAAAEPIDLTNLGRFDKKIPLRQWGPIDQFFPFEGSSDGGRSGFGYSGAYGALVLADELGDQLSELGRYSLVGTCLDRQQPDVNATFAWAVCGQDAKDLDLVKLAHELKPLETVRGQKMEFGDKAIANVAEWQKIGAAVEELAKTDKGVAAVLALGASARTEWAAFAGKNKDQLALLDKLQDSVRANKEGLGGDCLKTTAPPFQKLVHASKPPSDEDGDIMDFYYRQLPETTDAYITTLSYAACLLTLTPVGQGPYTVAGNRDLGKPGMVRRGPRTLAVAKAYDKAFKPKFSDRDVQLFGILNSIRGGVQLVGTGLVSSIGTPTDGVVSKITKKDDETTIVAFAGDKVEACLQWKDTNKVSQITNGNVTYEKKCMKRGMVDNETRAAEVPTILMAGITKGSRLIAIFGMPVVAYKPKTDVITAIWGVAR